LIDGDILTYRIGFAYEKEPINLCLWNVDKSIHTIADYLGGIDYLVYLTSNDRSNFRFSIRPDYKGNRTAAKPVHYETIRSHLIERHKARVSRGIEADDAIGIDHASTYKGKSVVCSIDKDFRQVPGWNFHFVRRDLDWISRDEAAFFFWKQVLTGDRTDNIRGIKGLGDVKSSKRLEGCSKPWEYLRTVRRIYLDHFGKAEGDLRLVENLNLLRIKQEENEPLVTLDDIEASLSLSLPLYWNHRELSMTTKQRKSRSSSRKRKETT
jgi:hypothetical protein